MKLIDLSRRAKFRVSGMKRFSQNIKRPLCGSVLCFFLLSIMEMNCAAQDIKNLALPGDFECLVDKANLIDSEHKKKILNRGKRLLKNTETPIFVVTINKMSDHVDEEMSIKTFADLLFKQWRIGSSGTGENLSKGVLLLVSKQDSQLVPLTVNIHLGAGWGQEKDNHKYWVMTKRCSAAASLQDSMLYKEWFQTGWILSKLIIHMTMFLGFLGPGSHSVQTMNLKEIFLLHSSWLLCLDSGHSFLFGLEVQKEWLGNSGQGLLPLSLKSLENDSCFQKLAMIHP